MLDYGYYLHRSDSSKGNTPCAGRAEHQAVTTSDLCRRANMQNSSMRGPPYASDESRMQLLLRSEPHAAALGRACIGSGLSFAWYRKGLNRQMIYS